MDKPQLREKAREEADIARTLLGSDTNLSLRHAALALRMALEALIYQRAWLYRDELAEEHYSVWQPRKLLAALLEIDPYAASPITLNIGKDPTKAPQEDEYTSLGSEHVLSLKVIRKHYDALGNYLHTPTLA